MEKWKSTFTWQPGKLCQPWSCDRLNAPEELSGAWGEIVLSIARMFCNPPENRNELPHLTISVGGESNNSQSFPIKRKRLLLKKVTLCCLWKLRAVKKQYIFASSMVVFSYMISIMQSLKTLTFIWKPGVYDSCFRYITLYYLTHL